MNNLLQFNLNMNSEWALEGIKESHGWPDSNFFFLIFLEQGTGSQFHRLKGCKEIAALAGSLTLLADSSQAPECWRLGTQYGFLLGTS